MLWKTPPQVKPTSRGGGGQPGLRLRLAKIAQLRHGDGVQHPQPAVLQLDQLFASHLLQRAIDVDDAEP